jgi:carbamoyl-phosphate synthase large subunit
MESVSREVNMKPILVTGSGCPGWYSVFLQLNDWKERNGKSDMPIFGCDMVDNTYGREFSELHFKVKKGDDTGYINEISNIVRIHSIDTLIPLTDPELLPLSSSLNDSGCKVLVSNEEDLKRILNKDILYKRLSDISPEFIYCDTIDDVTRFMKRSSDDNSCFLKLVSSYGSRGTKKLLTDKKWIEGFCDKKPEGFGYTFPMGGLPSLLNGFKLIAVEALPGKEYSIDCVFDSHTKLFFYGVREREEIRNGICHTAKFIVDTDKEFLAVIDKISELVKMKYNINIQVKRDVNGDLKLLEINPRISGSIGSFFSVGYNLVGMGMDAANQNSLNKYNELTPTNYAKPRSYRVSHFIGGA